MISILMSLKTRAQTVVLDSFNTAVVKIQSDTFKNSDLASLHSPAKATKLALLLPGAGQIYNRKYWKLPILYSGFVGLAYGFNFNQSEYQRFANYYRLATDDDPNTNPEFIASPEQLRQRRNYYKKNRDLTIIGFVGLYALQVLDANVDAHLMQFDMTDDITLHLRPFVPLNQAIMFNGISNSHQLSLVLRF